MLRMLPAACHHGVGVPESRVFRGSMPWPAFPPVNAHDSGPVWLATPSLYDSFIHYISPAFTGARWPTLSVPADFPVFLRTTTMRVSPLCGEAAFVFSASEQRVGEIDRRLSSRFACKPVASITICFPSSRKGDVMRLSRFQQPTLSSEAAKTSAGFGGKSGAPSLS